MREENSFFRKGVLTAAASLSFLVFAPSSFAKITLGPDFEGSVMITSPSGETSLIEKGDPIPEIPANSLIEVFGGRLEVITEAGDQLKMGCLGHQGVVAEEAKFDLTCSEDSGLLKVAKGTAHVVDPSGKDYEVAEGGEYPIRLFPAPPAAADTTAGFSPEGDPAVDSRGLETSPST